MPTNHRRPGRECPPIRGGRKGGAEQEQETGKGMTLSIRLNSNGVPTSGRERDPNQSQATRKRAAANQRKADRGWVSTNHNTLGGRSPPVRGERKRGVKPIRIISIGSAHHSEESGKECVNQSKETGNGGRPHARQSEETSIKKKKTIRQETGVGA